MIKNPSPRVLSFGAATIVSLTLSLLFALLKVNANQAILSVLLIFLTTFFLVHLSIDYFIYRKIKVIYKSINRLKSTKNNKPFSFYLGNGHPMDLVQEEVKEWATAKQIEIAHLKEQEVYRKEFLGNVSHELKTPIFSIQGYVNTLLDGAIDDEKVNKHFLNKASKSADRMATLVMDLERISELETGQMTLEIEEFNINDLLRDCMVSQEFRANQKEITLSFKDGLEKSFDVLADKSQIRQVIINLLTNSIKYSNNGGKTLIGLYDMDENILVEITDQGIGIEESHLGRLFERFYRVDKSRSRDEGGTGLGLAIVKHILEAHQQSINVRSTVGVGTTFGFTLKKV